MTFLVVLICFGLRNIFIKLVFFSGENKSTKIASATMYTVLLVTFFNYGLLYIIAPANFNWIGAEEGSFFSGIYTDFTSQWFLDIGVLILETSAFNIIFPLIEFLLFLIIRVIKRCIDQKSICPTDKYKTRAKTISDFEAIYSGPDFFVHYRLSFIVNIVFVTFLFGPGQPILFFVAFVGLVVTYISERIRMAYSYKKPPMYDSRLTAHTLKSLNYAVYFYAGSAAWLFSNQQVFRNKVPEIDGFTLYPLQGHHIVDLFTQITPGTIFTIYLFAALGLWLLRTICTRF